MTGCCPGPADSAVAGAGGIPSGRRLLGIPADYKRHEKYTKINMHALGMTQSQPGLLLFLHLVHCGCGALVPIHGGVAVVAALPCTNSQPAS